MENFDAVIVGAGPAGLAMALALGGETILPRARVLVVDMRDPRSGATVTTDSRGSALTRATQNMLKALKCWDALQPNVCEMSDVIVTDGAGGHQDRPTLLFFATEPSRTPTAVITENRYIVAALLDGLDRSSGIEMRGNTRIANVSHDKGSVRIQFDGGSEVSTPLLIGADGRHSFVRQQLGINVDTRDDNQTALTFSIEHELPHGGRAEEHFSPSGVFALLPLPKKMSSVVWGTTPNEAASLMALDELAFARALSDKVGKHLGELKVVGRRQAYPLKRQVAKAITGKRAALVGDAAHIIHPLAGLGLNLGFKDVAALAECIVDAMQRGEDLGSAQVLARYETWRRFDILTTVAAMESMNTLFANDHPVLLAMRRVGLRVVDRLPTIKSVLMEEASGMTGDLPRLMRGI